MSHERIENLFQQIEKKDTELKEWVALMLTGAIVSDKHLEESETIYLETLLSVLGDDAAASKKVKEIVDSRETPQLAPKNIDSDLAEQIFECMLEICGGDQELHPGEIQYLRAMGALLKIDYLELQYMIRNTGIKVKTAAFHGVLEDLNTDQKFWLGSVILKMIYSDQHISAKESIYLKDLDDLWKERPEALMKVKINPRELLSESIQETTLTPDLSGRVIKYLLGLAVSDGELEKTEEALIRQVAGSIGYSSQKLEEDITTIKSFESR
ncbi:MAG: TerB family tellurite resistance protein [SAR324 cluster bacterium]|nr:TerB family tellurite resistance protein [SAR324 cluster bacterium]